MGSSCSPRTGHGGRLVPRTFLLRQRYREGQEDQLGVLGLVVNLVVLWNTRYLDTAVTHLKARGVDMQAEDVARLSPLGFDRINVALRHSRC
jgi:hypothetical protein